MKIHLLPCLDCSTEIRNCAKYFMQETTYSLSFSAVLDSKKPNYAGLRRMLIVSCISNARNFA